MSDTALSSIQALCGTFIGLTTIVVTSRFVVRKWLKMPLKADDWCMLIAVISFIGEMSLVLALGGEQWIGYGKYPFPASELPTKYKETYKLIIAFDICTHLGLTFTKASALFWYRRVFCSHHNFNRTLNLLIIGTLVVLACSLVAFSFMAGFQCRDHLSEAWNPKVYDQYCGLAIQYLYGLYITDFILDIWVLALPIPNILRLHMTWTRRVCTAGVFLLAFVGLGASIARFVNFFELEVEGLDTVDVKNGPEDPFTRFIFFNILEVGSMMVAINLPALWGLFTKMGPEAVVKWARSLASLGSRGSSRSNVSSQSQPAEQGRRNESDDKYPSVIRVRTDIDAQVTRWDSDIEADVVELRTMPEHVGDRKE